MGQNPPKYGKRLNLGGVAAEADDLLEAAFYQTANFETIESNLTNDASLSVAQAQENQRP